MIQYFNDAEIRKSGVIYDSVFEQIKRMYLVDPEQAGELAIAAIELVLTGQISSDDVMIDMLLQPMAKMADVNRVKYEQKVEATRGKQIVDQKLEEIAEMYLQKVPQRVIGERLGLSQQIISYRLSVIKSKYPELLQIDYKNTKTTKNEVFVENSQTVHKNTNTLQTNLQINDNDTKVTKTGVFVEDLQIPHKNTKVTKDTKICTKPTFVEGDEIIKTDEVPPSTKPEFVF